jgi:hypothetical protein
MLLLQKSVEEQGVSDDRGRNKGAAVQRGCDGPISRQ